MTALLLLSKSSGGMPEWLELVGVGAVYLAGVLLTFRLNAADDRAERKEARDRRIHTLEREVGLHDD